MGRLPVAEVLLAAPRGFCAGVSRAIKAVRDALEVFGPPVYVRHAIVHNETVVRELEQQGAVFVEELSEVPRGGVVVFSAHGVSPAIAREARRRGLRAHDAVCPLVAKVHREVEHHAAAGRHVVVVGHAGHPEIVGTLGHASEGAATVVASVGDVERLRFAADRPMAYAVQTTFSVDDAAGIVAALKRRFVDLAGPRTSDICYATTNRQAAVRVIAAQADAVIVAGARFSSNANRLAEVARESCAAVQLVGDADELKWNELPPLGGRIGLTAAASTPESEVGEILHALRQRYRLAVTEIRSANETTTFRPVAIGRA
ncbi:MAG TPA: 4-hydroxy-3-methylbut-2-enyl diphosphate reductase [Croceibacterium sp.]|nr:4-hydroxy-3-methylbut-2-enyl diphosphate reductase [Croceibacterium sp.]